MLQLLLEQFECPAVSFMQPSVLSLYATGSTDGLILDCGDGMCYASACVGGFEITRGAQRLDLGGRDITRQLQLLLRKQGYLFNSSADLDVLREVKEAMCYVSQNPARDEANFAAGKGGIKRYKLPDGSQLELGAEAFRAAEILFDPDLVGLEQDGVADMVVHAINDADLDLRRRLYANILLVGGTSKLPGTVLLRTGTLFTRCSARRKVL